MFQTEISFLLGADISIFPPWSPGKAGEAVSMLTAVSRGEDSHVHQPPGLASLWLHAALLPRAAAFLPPFPLGSGSGWDRRPSVQLCPEGRWLGEN